MIKDSQKEEKETTPLYLPPRRTRAVQFYEHADEDSKSKKRKLDSKRSRESEELSTKEIKSLVHGLLRYASLSKTSQILADAKIYKKAKGEKALQEIVEKCQDIENEYHESKKGKIQVEYGGVKINATDVNERMEEMATLIRKISPYEKNPKNFRLNILVKSVRTPYSWTPKDDAMLLFGIYKHGFGCWDTIRSDPVLDLDRSKHGGEPLPKSQDLKRRSEVLIRELQREKSQKRKSDISPKKVQNLNPPKKRPKLDKAKPALEIKSTRPSSSRRKEPEREESQDSDASDEDEEPYDKKCLNQCKLYLKNVQSQLQAFKDMSSDKITMSKQEKIKKTREYISTIGTEISKVLKRNPHKLPIPKLERHLWHYASTFTAQNGAGLKQLYQKISSN